MRNIIFRLTFYEEEQNYLHLIRLSLNLYESIKMKYHIRKV